MSDPFSAALVDAAPKLRAWIRRHNRRLTNDDIADIVQEVLTRALVERENYNSGKSLFVWLVLKTRDECANFWRQRYGRKQPTTSKPTIGHNGGPPLRAREESDIGLRWPEAERPAAEDVEGASPFLDEHIDLLRALKVVPEGQGDIIRFFFEGYTAGEIKARGFTERQVREAAHTYHELERWKED